MVRKAYGENPPEPMERRPEPTPAPPLPPILAQRHEKLAQLLTDRSVPEPYTDLSGKRSVHDPMICQANKQGRDRTMPCEPCIEWAFRTLEQIAEIVGVELPVYEELT